MRARFPCVSSVELQNVPYLWWRHSVPPEKSRVSRFQRGTECRAHEKSRVNEVLQALCKNKFLFASPVLLALSAVAASNFDAARREAVKIVKYQVALECNDRKKAEEAFVFGMREGGATFGLGQAPRKVKADPFAADF